MSPAIDAFAEEYIAYIRETYMSGRYGNELEGYEWNAYERIPDGFLTNNPSEGANNRLFSRAGTIHPGIYRFCGLLQKETENVKNKCDQFEEGTLQPGRSTTRASKVKQNRIQLKLMLERGQQSLRKYLRTLGRMNHVVKNSRARRGGQNLGAASLLRGFFYKLFIFFQIVFNITIQVHWSLSQRRRQTKQIHQCELVVLGVGAWGGQVVREDEELLLQHLATGVKSFVIHIFYLS